MRKGWLMALLVVGISVSVSTQGATTKSIDIVYNGVELKLDKAPIIRSGQVWLPCRALSKNMGYDIHYEKGEQMVYIRGKNTPQLGLQVVMAGSKEDDGYHPILQNDTVYLSVRRTVEAFAKDVRWDGKNKTVYISSCISIDNEEEKGTLKYDTETGNFYDGEKLIAKLPFKCIDSLYAEKHNTSNGHVVYSVNNSYGEPHINDELYSVYVVDGDFHIAESFKWASNGENCLIKDNKVVLVNKNEMTIYDDVTGKKIKSHTISTEPLKAYLSTIEDGDTQYEDSAKGYFVEEIGDDFALYRNYQLKALMLVNLKTGQETTLYKVVYPASEIETVEKGIHEEGDYLKFVKQENGTIYLKNEMTNKTYAYQYE